MGLMDKFKNLFTDEEIIEEDEVDTVEIKEVKKEEEVNKLPTFMREKIEKEEKSTVSKKSQDKDLEVLEEKEEKKKKDESDVGFELPKIEEKNTFKFPLDLTDNDFVETRSRQSIHQKKPEVLREEVRPVASHRATPRVEKKVKAEPKVADLYKDRKEPIVKEKSKFRATPIISPIYGVLDKNYTSNDIDATSRNDLESNRHSKNVDFDSVRKKAYGSLSEEIKENLMCENCEYLREAKECQRERERLEDVEYETYETYDDSYEDTYEENTYKDVTLDEATENYYDYGVPYEKEDTEKEEIKISNFEQEEVHEERRPKKEIPPVKSNINLLSTLKKSMGDSVEETPKKEENLELTDDLFNLIDSMYDERNE